MPILVQILLNWATAMAARAFLVAFLAVASCREAQRPDAPPPPTSTSNSTLYESPELPATGGTIVIGIAMGLTASICVNVGNNVQAIALSRMSREGTHTTPRLWWVGTSLFAFGSIINFAAFPFAPAAVLAPLESIQFVTNLLFARFVNHVAITWPMIVGSSLVIAGTFVAIYFGPSQVVEFPGVDEVAALWLNPPWIIYLLVANLAAAALLWVHWTYDEAVQQGNPKRRSELVLPFSFAVSTAIYGGFCVAAAKTSGELVTIFLSGDYSVVGHWFFHVNNTLLLVCMVVWLGRLNTALRKYDPIFIIPLVQAHYIIFSVLSGMFFFEEYKLMTTALAWSMFIIGIIIMLAGLLFLAPTGCFSRKAGKSESTSLLVKGQTHYLLEQKSNTNKSTCSCCGAFSLAEC